MENTTTIWVLSIFSNYSKTIVVYHFYSEDVAESNRRICEKGTEPFTLTKINVIH